MADLPTVTLQMLETVEGERLPVMVLRVTPKLIAHTPGADAFWQGEVLPLLRKGAHVSIVLTEPHPPEVGHG